MSFDWLNVPGLRVDSDSHASVTNSPPLPNVSFKFGDESIAVNDYQHTIKQAYVSNDQYNTNKDEPERYQGIATRSETIRTHENDAERTNKNTNPSYKHSSKTNSDTSHEYSETSEDVRVPLSLSSSALEQQEFKAYKRWYNYMAFRRHPQPVRLEDIFGFLSNFHLTPQIKERTQFIFRTCQMSVSMGEFFAVMRVISHALHNGQLPTRKMIVEKAPVPRPKSILSTETGQETYEEVEADPKSELDNKVDFDSFASLLLTGQKVRKNIRRKVIKRSGKVKKVAFSENIATFHEELKITDEKSTLSSTAVNEVEEENALLDFSLPMDQLLKKMAERKRTNSALVSNPPTQPESAEEMEELADMRDSLSHFKQIQTGDNVNLSDVTNKYMTYMAGSTGSGSQGSDAVLQPLQPTATGSANHLFRSHLAPQMNASPNGVIQNPQQQILEPLKPTATGSANRLFKSHMESMSTAGMGHSLGKHGSSTQQTSQQMEALQPTATGSANYLMKQHFVTSTPEKATLAVASTPSLHGQNTSYISSSSPTPHLPGAHNLSDMTHSPQLTQNQISSFNGAANAYNLPYQQPGALSVSDTELGKYYNPMFGSSPVQLTPQHTPQIPYRPPVQNTPYLMVPPQSQYMNPNIQNIQSVASDPQLFHNDPYSSSSAMFSQSHQQPNPQQQHPFESNHQPPSRDILGDLRALQHQVNQMQHSYARR